MTCLIVATCIGPYQHTYETIWCILDASLWKVKHTSIGQFVQLPMRKSVYGLRSKSSLFDSQPACAVGLPSPIFARSMTIDCTLDNAIEDTSENQNEPFSSNGFNPFSFLSSLQIGSGVPSDVGWSEPQMVTMDLVGSTGANQEEQLNLGNVPTADFALVSVIHYTGLANSSTTLSSTIR